jgi:malic enzyme
LHKLINILRVNFNIKDNYTIKNNLVAVISDGSAVLGLGNVGPLASKPVSRNIF